MAEITWDKNIQPEHKENIEGLLKPFLWLLPGWLQSLHVHLDGEGEEEGETISIKVNYEYRFATLYFVCAWLNQDATARQQQIVHELLHVSLCLVANFSRDTINNLCPESEAEKFNKHLLNTLRERHESAVQDLAFAVYNQFCPIK